MNKDKWDVLISKEPSKWQEKATERAKETTMSKEEAIAAMKNGKRVYHSSFYPDEYLYMKGEWVYDEDSYYCHESFWWNNHTSELFETGWKIMDFK